MKNNMYKHLILLEIIMLTSIVLTAQNDSPKITKPIFIGKSKPVREMRIVLPGEHEKEQRIVPNRFPPRRDSMPYFYPPVEKAVLQKKQGLRRGRGPLLNFEGVGNVNGGFPADPNGNVGLDHYVQTVNSSFAVWDKSRNLLYGPVDNQTIWESFPGPWNSYFWCDPVFKYDQLADRWVISSLSYSFNPLDFYTMIAVSTTNDPLGPYYCYAYHFLDLLNDYPKLSVWPNGYYVTYNIWGDSANTTFLYSLATVVDRDAMLNGSPDAMMIQFQVPYSQIDFFPLPADLSGDSLPDDTPCYVVNLGNHDPLNPTHLLLDIYSFDVNWDVPANSTFQQTNQFDIGVFEPLINYGPGAPQLGSSVNVDAIPYYLMYPLTYRKFADHETMVCSNTIWDGEIHYIKWHELRKENEGWYIYQSGGYAPGEAHYFIPSISINGNGDIAMGYTVSSEEMYPSIRFTGRRAEDSLGVMTFQEIELYKGLNYANSYDPFWELNRWGDYSSMMVDPSDDTTFWYTNMYTNATSGPGNWNTRIFSLSLSGDSAMPYAFAGNDTVAYNVTFFETQGEAENYSSIIWTTSGDGTFITNYSENILYLRGPGDLEDGQVILTIHLTGYYEGTVVADNMILFLSPVAREETSAKEIALKLFPNPAKDFMTLQADVPAEELLLVEIIGLEGKTIFTGRYTPINSNFELLFDTSSLMPGIYLVRLQTGKGKTTKKLVIQ